jgi:hypothetical protein
VRIKKSQTVMTHRAQLARLLSAGEKQPGRRYGPRPALVGHQRTLEPLTNDRREANYRAQTGRIRRQPTRQDDVSGAPQAYARLMGLTPRQRRRSWHKELSAARVLEERELARRVDAELAALPQQRERKEVQA